MPLKTEQLSHETTPLQSGDFPFVLVCDGITSPANAGSLFRLCDALGIRHLYFCNSNLNFESSRFKRTARSTETNIPFTANLTSLEVLSRLEENDFYLVGLELTTTSIPLSTFDVKSIKKIALVLGNERSGISQQVLEKIKETIHIPMHGKNSSMNVAQAAAIAAYSLINNRL